MTDGCSTLPSSVTRAEPVPFVPVTVTCHAHRAASVSGSGSKPLNPKPYTVRHAPRHAPRHVHPCRVGYPHGFYSRSMPRTHRKPHGTAPRLNCSIRATHVYVLSMRRGRSDCRFGRGGRGVHRRRVGQKFTICPAAAARRRGVEGANRERERGANRIVL